MSEQAALPVLGLAANAYLILGPRLTIVDPGAHRVMKLVGKALAAVPALEIADIAFVTATHWHVDHVAGLSEVFRRTNAELYLSEKIAYHLEGGKRIVYPPFHRFINMLRNRPDVTITMPRPIDFLTMDLIGLPLERGTCFPYKVKSYYKDGDALPGHPDWRVIETPGHSPDSVCFWHEKSGSLIAGDTILGGRLGAAPNRFLWNDDAYAESLSRLSKLRVRRLLPGHGCLLEGDDLLSKL